MAEQKPKETLRTLQDQLADLDIVGVAVIGISNREQRQHAYEALTRIREDIAQLKLPI